VSAPQRETWIIYAQFVVLLAVVAIADVMLIRIGLTAAVGLLLVQRAVGARAAADAAFAQRRHDPITREAVGQLLERIREFYAACHLAGSGQMLPPEAVARTTAIEKDLNALLDKVIRVSRGEALPAEVAS